MRLLVNLQIIVNRWETFLSQHINPVILGDHNTTQAILR